MSMVILILVLWFALLSLWLSMILHRFKITRMLAAALYWESVVVCVASLVAPAYILAIKKPDHDVLNTALFFMLIGVAPLMVCASQ